MLVKLFDLENGKVIPTIHCYNLKFLKDIMAEFPTQYMQIYSYLFYMTCPDPDLNPYFNAADIDKEEWILKEIGAEFSTDEPLIIEGLEKCEKLYETPTSRAYQGIKAMLDRIAVYMKNSPIVDGRDGNGTFLLKAAKEFSDIRKSFKETYNDLKEEQSVRGNQDLAYDG